MLDLWYKNAAVYSLNVATYKDSDGDGVGDFKGLAAQLDHIAQLGVNCLWLLPFYPSPGLDHGYDVTDYYNVAPALGTLGDFVEFSHQARLRGIRLIIDLPINHTSEQHAWFQQARADPESPFRDYYVWSDTEPENSAEGVVFPGVQLSVWTYDLCARSWYYHRFYQHQPDLNIACSAVREEIFKIVGFWLELGVSGFRIDAAPFVVEEIRPDRPPTRRYEFFGELRDFLSWRRGDAVLLAEANVAPAELGHYFGDGSRIHLLFAFLLNQHLFLALARGKAEPLRACLAALPRLPAFAQWAQFLRNHDELDLGRLTVDERGEIYAAFAPALKMQLYGRGIRRRLACILGNDRQRMELAYSLLFSLPGTPVIYYGDELGMGDNLALPERWPVRTCMQWADVEGGGFSPRPAARLLYDIVKDAEYGPCKVNAVAQQRDPESLFNWLRRLVELRKSCLEIGWGDLSLLPAHPLSILAQKFAWEGRSVLILHNLSETECRAHVEGLVAGQKLTDLFGNRVYPSKRHADSAIDIDGYGYRWFRLD
ncbi:putative trehalose synthase (Glycosyl hydrolase) protein [Bradyrhizobium sp. ORS 285]|uniref:alpha-amylase family protein n=1 Tax=Bradyrhizobium sp. ORS 285 TaxID=115808 RepID=UPI00024089AC|nr:alpha-amylase family protein [Bradyrhizobium sp. ORS 285]CCD86267.1 putative trehalose synthase (Glycosyl hydrolase) protein [Bradyrhizobium sp. ORS 285]SMX61236.1 putative trehalose synthase (Glycosyl hydrolase) protein [Bradyrhizobium sp. ORS 285]